VNNFLGQLNLTAQERRIVAVIFLVVIIVINFLFVWPHFGEWGSINRQLDEKRKTMENWNNIIKQDLNPTNGWKEQVAKLARLEGGNMMEHPVDPQVQFQNTIRTQERKTGVYVANYNPGSVKTNEFFEEHSTTISIESQEPQLVDFLYNMGLDPAMIRVAKLDLKPADANRYRLKGGITLTANYAKKPATTVSVAPAVKPAPGPRPAASPRAKQPSAPAQTAKHPAAARPAPEDNGPPPGVNRPTRGGQKNRPPNGRRLRPGRGRPNPGNNPGDDNNNL